jgi:hypothetical protein
MLSNDKFQREIFKIMLNTENNRWRCKEIRIYSLRLCQSLRTREFSIITNVQLLNEAF